MPSLLPANGGAEARTTRSYHVLHSFGTGNDGAVPAAGLTVFRGHLYGTTVDGGALGVGTVYRMSTSGEEHVIHSFDYSDGSRPEANLLEVSDALYGTTTYGGAHGFGAAFKVTRTGTESVVYSLRGYNFGANPLADVSELNGTLYGTGYDAGGGCGYVGCGVVFQASPNGGGRILHSFGSGFGRPQDPSNPQGGLLPLNGVLYGTTNLGGDGALGTVYRISPATGRVQVLHDFANDGDGWNPLGDLTLYDGLLYGTTQFGGSGTKCAGAGGCGTVYRITPGGTYAILYSFQGGTDGTYPSAGVVVLNGMLYGTTQLGGSHCTGSGGCGTVFSLTPSGQERILHSFAGGSDGAQPNAALTAYRGILYGTTTAGGSANGGTAFALTPSP